MRSTAYSKIAFFLEEETVSVGEQEFEVAQLRTIDGRVVDFRDDAPAGS